MVVDPVAGQEVIVKYIDHDARIPARYSLGTLLGSANHGVCIGEPINCSMQQDGPSIFRYIVLNDGRAVEYQIGFQHCNGFRMR